MLETDQEKIEEERLKQSLALKAAYKSTFSGREGQIVLNDLMKYCHMMGPTYRGDIDDTVYNEGMRNVALYILKIINTDMQSLRQRYENIQKETERGYFE